MQIDLSNNEQLEVEKLAVKYGISPNAIVRKAVRLFQTIDLRLEQGLITNEDVKKVVGGNLLDKLQG